MLQQSESKTQISPVCPQLPPELLPLLPPEPELLPLLPPEPELLPLLLPLAVPWQRFQLACTQTFPWLLPSVLATFWQTYPEPQVCPTLTPKVEQLAMQVHCPPMVMDRPSMQFFGTVGSLQVSPSIQFEQENGVWVSENAPWHAPLLLPVPPLLLPVPPLLLPVPPLLLPVPPLLLLPLPPPLPPPLFPPLLLPPLLLPPPSPPPLVVVALLHAAKASAAADKRMANETRDKVVVILISLARLSSITAVAPDCGYGRQDLPPGGEMHEFRNVARQDAFSQT